MVHPSKSSGIVTEAEAAQILDRQHLRRYTLGDAALERELLQLFSDQTQQSLGQLKAAATASEWKLACHTLKGSAAAVGAAEINRLAARLEARGFAGRPVPSDADFVALGEAVCRFRETVGRILG